MRRHGWKTMVLEVHPGVVREENICCKRTGRKSMCIGRSQGPDMFGPTPDSENGPKCSGATETEGTSEGLAGIRLSMVSLIGCRRLGEPVLKSSPSLASVRAFGRLRSEYALIQHSLSSYLSKGDVAEKITECSDFCRLRANSSLRYSGKL